MAQIGMYTKDYSNGGGAELHKGTSIYLGGTKDFAHKQMVTEFRTAE